jgi:hypothetical protein
MTESSNNSPLDAHVDELKALASQGLSMTDIAAQLTERGVPTSRDSVRRAFKRHNIERPALLTREPDISIKGDTAVLIGGDAAGPRLSPDDLIRMRHLDPADWEIKDMIINEWDAMMGEKHGNATKPMYQIKLFLTRKKPIEFVFPGKVPTDYIPPKIIVPRFRTTPTIKVICGDGQVPHNDKGMEDCFLQFLADIMPDELVDIGDQGDNPSVSSYKKNAQWHVPINDCIQATVELNYYRRRAAENMKMVILLGNHEARLVNFTMTQAESLYGIKQGDIPDDPKTGEHVLQWASLTRAKDLGIEVIGNEDDSYEHASYKLVDHPHGALAEHGNKTGKTHSQKMIERRIVSLFYGHTHDQTIDTKTLYDINNDPRTIYSVNIGTQSLIKGGLGYVKNPDWVHGFALLIEWPDGRFHVELVKYEQGVMYWRDKRYFANPNLL